MVSQVETIALLSDLHTGKDKRGNERFDPRLGDLTVERVNRLGPDLTLFAGDLTANGEPEQYERAGKFLERIECPAMVITKGQHDWNPDYPHGFEEHFGHLPSYNEFGDIAVIALDSVDRDRSKVRSEIDALEFKVRHSIKLTKGEKAWVEKEMGRADIAYDIGKDPHETEFFEHGDYYKNVMSAYTRRRKRLEEILRTDLEYGFIGTMQRKYLSEIAKHAHSRDVQVTIVLTHYSVMNDDFADNPIVDGGNLKRACREEDVNLLVVGDRHVSGVEFYNQGGKPGNPVTIFQVGSATNIQHDPNQFGVMEIDREDREISLYSLEVKTGELARGRFSGNPYYPVRFSF